MSIIQQNKQSSGCLNVNHSLFNDAQEVTSGSSFLQLGNEYVKNKQYQQALLAFIKANLLEPQDPLALVGCAIVLLALNRSAESAIYAEKALALNPNQRNLNVYGQALYQMGHYTQALDCFSAETDCHTTLSQRALCLTQLNRYDDAMKTYQKALQINPADAVLLFNYAICLLVRGDLPAGFRAFESRWQSQLRHRTRPWVFPSDVTADVLRGKSILIHTEQGLGDSLQFFRYIPLLVERGAHVNLEIQPALIPLLSSWCEMITFVAAGSPLPVCDYQWSMLSLAFIFRTDVHTIPTPIPYVFSEPFRVELCRQKLQPSHRKRVGIAWRGSVLNQSNHKRSIALQTLLACHHPYFDFVCLQHDVTHDEKQVLDHYSIPYYALELSTFEGTAALISCLDLVVTIDTSIAHLAGAMGKEVWILLAFSPDWRWLLDREDSPWYPSARLFRQVTIGDWQHPLLRIKEELSHLVTNKAVSQANGDHSELQKQALLALEQNNLPMAIQWMEQAAQAAPFMPLYRRNLGELLRRAGQYDAAISSHKIAVELDPNIADTHFHLGLALNDNQQYEMAIVHYRLALSLDEQHGLAWNNLGASLEHLGDMLGAKEAYTKAVGLNVAHAEAQNNLGAVCTVQGLLDDAKTHFTAAISANPDFVEAHYNLSSLKTYHEDDPHLHMLESITERASVLTDDARIRYNFALGKALDDAGQYARAFQAYAEGNRLKYAQQPWNETRFQGLSQQIKSVFTSSYLSRNITTKDRRIPIFIVGMPRSGTTLIEQTLSSHNSIFGAGESSILDEVIHSAKGAEYDKPFTSWVAPLSDKECIDMGKAYLDRTWELAPDAHYITDKMPGNCFYIGMIYRMLPQAKIIHAMRDPMDTCFSCFTKLFNCSMPYAYDLSALGRYFMYYAEIMRHWHTVLPTGFIFDLSYEKMVADHEHLTKQLLDYIGLPWDPNCLNFHKNDRLVKTASVAQVRKPIYHTSVKRWEHFKDELQTLLTIVSSNRLDSFP